MKGGKDLNEISLKALKMFRLSYVLIVVALVALSFISLSLSKEVSGLLSSILVGSGITMFKMSFDLFRHLASVELEIQYRKRIQ